VRMRRRRARGPVLIPGMPGEESATLCYPSLDRGSGQGTNDRQEIQGGENFNEICRSAHAICMMRSAMETGASRDSM